MIEWVVTLAIVLLGAAVGYALARQGAAPTRVHKNISLGRSRSGDAPDDETSEESLRVSGARHGRSLSDSGSDSSASSASEDEDDAPDADVDLALTLDHMKTEHAAHIELFPSAAAATEPSSPPLPVDTHRRVFIVSKWLPLWINRANGQPTPVETPMASPQVGATSAPAAGIDDFSLDGGAPVPTRSRNNTELKRPSATSVSPRVPVSGVIEKDGISYRIEWGDTRSVLANLRCLLAPTVTPPSTAPSTLPTGFAAAVPSVVDEPEVTWLGMSSATSVDKFVSPAERAAYEAALAKNHCAPVYLDAQTHADFDSFCKAILWPLLHYITPTNENSDVAVRWADYWLAYQKANEMYADAVIKQMDGPRAGDQIWIHHHELFCLPGAIRERHPRATIGCFIHSPFPSSDVFRSLPSRKEMLESLMACDLLGFQTFDYARHFLSCIKRVLDLDFETLPGGILGVRFHGRFVSILISHVGIESSVYREAADTDAVKRRVEQLRSQHAGKKIIVSVDEADVAHTPVLKIQAFDRFLSRHPEWVAKVVIIQLLTPSKNSDGRAIQRDLDAAIQSLRQKYGDSIIEVLTPTALELANPVSEVLDCGMKLPDLVRLYQAADVAVSTNFYDGSSLGPYECTASQGTSVPAALIISEFMGCSRSLNGVLRINPWSLEAISDALLTALTMSNEERRANHQRRSHYVTHHTCEKWATGCLDQLARATRLGAELNYVHVGQGASHKLLGLKSSFLHLPAELLATTYAAADLRVILLDYDGTLVPADAAADAASCASSPPDAVLQLLRLLSEQPNTVVFIMSGRTRAILTQWFGHLPELGLAAEKGLWLKWPASIANECRFDRKQLAEPETRTDSNDTAGDDADSTSSSESESSSSESENEDEDAGQATPSSVHPSDWESIIPLDVDCSWKTTASEIIRAYTEQTDGSWIEEKELAIVWHYEGADAEYGRMQALDLSRYLVRMLANPKVDVLRYDKSRILEVKPHGVSKGLAATAILESLWIRHENRNASPTRSGASTDIHTLPPSADSLFAYQSALSSPYEPMSPRTLATSFRPFVLAIGDDRSDEAMFLEVQAKSYLDGRMRGRETRPFVDFPRSVSMHTAVPQTPSNAVHDPETSPTPVSPTLTGDRRAAHSQAPSSDANLFTVCVGLKPSNAHFFVNDVSECLRSLYGLVLRDQADNASASAAAAAAEGLREDQAKHTGLKKRGGSFGKLSSLFGFGGQKE